MIPITALLVSLTQDQIRAVFVRNLVQLGIRADLWKTGGSLSNMLTVIAATFAGFTQTMVAALSAGFLPTATGAWLVILAYYVYGVVAVPATFATGVVTLTNTGGGIYTFAAGQLILGNANASGVQYTNSATVTIGAATSFGPMVVPNVAVIATILGSAGNANPGDVSVLVTTAIGVSVTNPGAVVGQDAQSDPSVRATCLAKLAALSVRNPRGSYKWAITTAINAVTNAPVNINRVQVQSPGATFLNGFAVAPVPPNPGAPGTVTIYAASPSGAPSSDDLTAAAASVELNARVEGVTVSLFAATEVPYTRTLNVWYQSAPSLTAAAVELAGATAITNFFAQYAIGGVTTDKPGSPTGIFGSAIGGQIVASQVPGVIVFVEDASNLGQPPPDLPLVVGQVATDDITLVARAVAVQ